MKKRILVFPCGSEIGLEIHRSMRYSTHFELVGGSSVEDHGRFVYDAYIGGLPMHDQPSFAERLADVVRMHRIDAIYPAMDAVAETLQNLAAALGVVVIGSSPRATAICASKSATYELLEGVVPLARRFDSVDQVETFPIFIKPDRGYGARNTLLAETAEAARGFLARPHVEPMLLLEYLPGAEWTVDCFSDRHGRLRFHGVRGRNRISNGISVNTAPSECHAEDFLAWAQAINQTLRPRGAWFFQARQDSSGRPRLLEVAARLGGSSGLFRCMGVNFALLSTFDAFDLDVDITPNCYVIELDRALDSRYRIKIDYQNVYVDLDDCLLIHGKVNSLLIGFLYKAVSEGKKLTLLTRHHQVPAITLRQYRIETLFDRVVHVRADESKSAYIDSQDAIFIDDSHAERRDVAESTGIPVFAPDMVEALL